jgi:hypothetical protein
MYIFGVISVSHGECDFVGSQTEDSILLAWHLNKNSLFAVTN